ncbi:MAG: tetratricopeptide repeat protein [Herpetosiphon sp.]
MRLYRRVGTDHWPQMMFLASLLVLISMLVFQSLRQRPQASLAVAPQPAAPLELGTEQMIAALQARLQRKPDDTKAYAQLGFAFLQRVRETADPSLYARAESAFNAALQREPQQLDAVLGQASLALSRHQFSTALELGEKAHAISPYRAQVYGTIGDAQVELGKYDEAVTSVQQMINTRPDLSSFTRVSYQREIHGDVPGAITAMQQAVSAGNPGTEQTLWTQVQLGNLFFNSGKLEEAEGTYRAALNTRPDYVYAGAGLARIAAARGQYESAIKIFREITQRLPVAEFVISLGELYEVIGKSTEARQQYDLVRAIEQLSAAAGVDVDLELALFDADHGADPATTVARARTAYSHRPTVYGANVLAWSLYHAGNYQEARHYSDQALRLGTRDANLYYHAGMIARALGDTVTARQQLTTALDINPSFSILYSSEAKKVLAELQTAATPSPVP